MYSTIISGRVYLFFLHFYYFISISRTIIKLDECSIILIHVYIYLSFNRKSVFWFFTSFQYFITTLGAKLLSLRLQRRIRRARKPDGVFRDSLSFANAHSCVSHFTLPTCASVRDRRRAWSGHDRETLSRWFGLSRCLSWDLRGSRISRVSGYRGEQPGVWR